MYARSRTKNRLAAAILSFFLLLDERLSNSCTRAICVERLCVSRDSFPLFLNKKFISFSKSAIYILIMPFFKSYYGR